MARRNRYLVVLATAAVLSGNAVASEIAPGDVDFTDDGVMTSLTGVAGDPAAGAAVFKDRRLGNCLACHANADMAGDLFHGNVGPEIDGVASRWEEPMLRAILVNSKKVFTDETVMPGFYSLDVGKDVAENFVGKTILTAQQVEDVVAYLGTLKE
jgi:sulfur-oxidizing protein SoxX